MSYYASPNRRKHWYRIFSVGQKKLIFVASVLVVLLSFLLVVLGVYGYRAWQYDLGRVNAGTGSSLLYDSTKSLIASISDEDKTFVSYDELPAHLVNAFVAREDERFFEHDGVVITSVVRSLLRNIMSMSYEQGASTITMQLTRNVFELTSKSMDRKILEAMLALRIEGRYDKKTILEQYLNRIFYGQNCYGIRSAARHYFGKEVKELDLVECATLAGLVRAPSLYNPVRSMDSARRVKAETLQRMLDCEMITQEECNIAMAAPIVLKKLNDTENPIRSYSVMWTRHELESMGEVLPEHSGTVKVVSSLILPLQQYVEQAVEKALVSVENPGSYPEAWLAGLTPEMALAVKNNFAARKRPADMKKRGEDNDMTGLLQCCVLSVDARLNHRGKVLALVGGRNAADGRERWLDKIMPGRVAAPLLFCCACLPGAENMHIVTKSTEITGRRLGYQAVNSFYESLKLPITIPSREHELQLYNGMYEIRRLDLARTLFCLLNDGRGYRLSMVNEVWNANDQLIYQYEPARASEYILRQAAKIVSTLPPFQVSEGLPVTLNETLPDGAGQWALVYRPRDACVFVWMGYDAPLKADDKRLKPLLSYAAGKLAREIFDKSRAELRAIMKKEKEEKQKALKEAQERALSELEKKAE